MTLGGEGAAHRPFDERSGAVAETVAAEMGGSLEIGDVLDGRVSICLRLRGR
ncbi:MAG: hypothetical protein M5R36_29200 [Deltaproteobacteria bacterium]|nr:hypothetical protein [Deltaproteobacteria bacterium]